MPLIPKEVDELDEATKKLLELWMRTKLVLFKAFGNEPVSKEHEAAFLQLKADISRVYRGMDERLNNSPGLKFEGDKMMEMLKNAMNMEHLKNLPAGEKQNIYVIWHLVYIKMTRTLGALEVMKAGYYPHLHRDRLKEKTSAKAGKGK